MKDLALDTTTGDLLLQDFDLQFVEDQDQIAQNLAIRLRFILGEWFLRYHCRRFLLSRFFHQSPQSNSNGKRSQTRDPFYSEA